MPQIAIGIVVLTYSRRTVASSCFALFVVSPKEVQVYQVIWL